MSGIPRLNLSNVASGGGWGVGENYAQMAPAALQMQASRPAFHVAGGEEAFEADPPHSSDEEEDERNALAELASDSTQQPRRNEFDEEHLPAATSPAPDRPLEHNVSMSPANGASSVIPQLPEGQCAGNDLSGDDELGDQPDDDGSDASSDGTFVDHNTAAKKKPAVAAAAPPRQRPSTQVTATAPLRLGMVPTTAHATQQAQRPNLYEPPRHDDEDDGGGNVSARRKWLPGDIVSTLELQLPVRAVEVVNGRVWSAAGEGPLSCYGVDGCDLALQHVIPSVTKIRSLCLVPEPAPTSQSPAAAGDGTRSSGGDTLWCGTDDGRIVIVSLFFQREDSAISAAHSAAVTHLVRTPQDRVWSAGKDKVLRLWDVATRRTLLRHGLSTTPRDLCLVSATNQLWTVGAQDKIIRVWDARDGKECRNVRVSVSQPVVQAVKRQRGSDAAVSLLIQGGEGSDGIGVNHEVITLRYHAATGSGWICMFERLVIVTPRHSSDPTRPGITVTQVQELPVTAPNVEFVRDDLAVVVGRGDLVAGAAGFDYVCIFKIHGASQAPWILKMQT
jgi:hypothetical protein